MEKIIDFLGLSACVVGILAVICLIIAFPVKWLWNGCLVGAVDGIHEISALRALGLAVLCGLLFRSVPSSNTSK